MASKAVGLAELAINRDDFAGFEQGGRAIDGRMQGPDELLRVLTGPPDLSDRSERGHVREIDVEHALPGFERFVVAVELLAEKPRTPREHHHAVFVAVGDVEVPLEHVGELRPA
jgi:hypothetical protein